MEEQANHQDPSLEPETAETASFMVSIIVPMYCCEEYVDDVLSALCAQDYQNLEIICVIDGSPDQSRSRAEAYAIRDSRIRVVSQAHGGAGTARNLGLSLAGGKYVMFLDADDLFPPTFVSHMVQAAEEKEAEIAICLNRMEDYWTGTTKEFSGYSPRILSRGSVLYPREIPDLLYVFSGITHNKIFLRSFIEAHQLRFSGTFSINDLFFVYTALCSADKIAMIHKSLYTYRKNHNRNSITSNRALSRQDLFIVFGELYDWLVQHQQADFYLKSYCKRWRFSFHAFCRYGVDEAFQAEAASFLSQREPWQKMSNQTLYHLAGLDTEDATYAQHQYLKQQKKLAAGTEAYIRKERARQRREYEVTNINAVRKQLEVIRGGQIKTQNHLLRAALRKGKANVIRWGSNLFAFSNHDLHS